MTMIDVKYCTEPVDTEEQMRLLDEWADEHLEGLFRTWAETVREMAGATRRKASQYAARATELVASWPELTRGQTDRLGTLMAADAMRPMPNRT